MTSKRTISRRDFLRVATIGAAGATLVACAPVAVPSASESEVASPDDAPLIRHCA